MNTMQFPGAAPTAMLPVTLIVTVRNEAASIAHLLDSMLAQTKQPAEVIITDGGSTDGTQEIISSYRDRLPLRLLEMPGANISEGRNAAIRNAAYSIIASTDAGVRLDPTWLEELTRPLLEPDMASPAVVSGFFLADPQTAFETAMGSTVLPALEDIDPRTFLPSSRSIAFRKEAWDEVGGYPEWLDYCEDVVFDIRLKEVAGPFHFAPQAVAYFRPRSDLRAFFLQYYRYARGDGKADLWRKRHTARYLAYIASPVLISCAWRRRQSWAGKSIMAAIALAGARYCYRPYLRLLPMLNRSVGHSLVAVVMVPVIRLTGDVAKMLGYPVGVWWRLKNRTNR